MDDLHAITSGLKAVVSHQGSLGAEQCRMSCGGKGLNIELKKTFLGHGYTLAARIPQLCARIIAGKFLETKLSIKSCRVHLRGREYGNASSSKQVDSRILA